MEPFYMDPNRYLSYECSRSPLPLFLQESPQDSAITRDINRTFPAHDYFKDTGGDGQDSLYKICKVFHIKI